MRNIFLISLLFLFSGIYAQDNSLVQTNDTIRKSLRLAPKQNPRATYQQYKIISIQKDTVYIDTSLTIKSDYKFNYLRKDTFGLLPLANDGNTYTVLNYGTSSNNSVYPFFGNRAKHFNYLDANAIQYYQVATPWTELYFKTVLEQGQSLDAFITLNLSKNFNFSIQYKGLRSLGKYLNSLSSNGNLIFTSSYASANKRYVANLHFTSQDFKNFENGGILNSFDFDSGNPQFTQRSRLDVRLSDAFSVLEGTRFFLNHSFGFNKKDATNQWGIAQQISYEKKIFSFKKATPTTYFGPSYLARDYQDNTNNQVLYHKIAATFTNPKIGKLELFTENYITNYYYNQYIINNNQIAIPNKYTSNWYGVGGKYNYTAKNIKAHLGVLKSVIGSSFYDLDALATYTYDAKNNLTLAYQNTSKIPDLNYTLYQSSFVAYNWYHNFVNPKTNTLKINANTQWAQAKLQFTTLKDYLFFNNVSVSNDTLLVAPTQQADAINYFSAEINKEFRLNKIALDNTILYQQVSTAQDAIHIPTIVTRNTLYYGNNFFNKALFLQTGFTLNYFSKYYGNGYQPLLGEFYSQKSTKIGGYPMFDFFVNGRIQQTRIFIKAENFNTLLGANKYYVAPNYPNRDFVIRFGLVWDFFQ